MRAVGPVLPVAPVRALADAIALPMPYESPVGDRYARDPNKRRLIRQMAVRRQQYTRRQ